MNLLADEGVDRQIVALLRERGHSAMWVAEMEHGTPDDQVLALANASGTLLLTGDKDFGEVVFRQRLVSAGVILLRLAGLTPDAKARTVATALSVVGSQMEGKFSVISPGNVRVRPHLP